MVENSSTSYKKESRRVDSSSNEDFKNITFFAREVLISRKGRSENLGKMARNREICCYVNYRVVNFNREYLPLLPGIKIFALLWSSYMPIEEVCFQVTICPTFVTLPSPKLWTFSVFMSS